MTEKEQNAGESPKELDPNLKDFIDRVIVPALVSKWLAEEQARFSLASCSALQNSESTG
jgi:hypothetical protein